MSEVTDAGNSPENWFSDKKSSFNAVSFEMSGTGPEKRLRLRLRTRSSVSEASEAIDPVSSRFSRTSRVTRFPTQETPVHLHGSVVEFHEKSFPVESAADLKFRRASKSELEEEERKQQRRSRERSKCWLKKDDFSILTPTNLQTRQEIERVSRRER